MFVEINDIEVKSCLVLKIINYLLCCSNKQTKSKKLSTLNNSQKVSIVKKDHKLRKSRLRACFSLTLMKLNLINQTNHNFHFPNSEICL